MIWKRAFVEALHEELPARTAEIIDFLADNPGRKFTISQLVDCLELVSGDALRGLLGELTKASKRVGIPQQDEHSWFVLWTDQPEFQYWLSQKRSDWWNRVVERNYWALSANRAFEKDKRAITSLRDYLWITKESKIKVGDRVTICDTQVKKGQRGIVALGEVVSIPEIKTDSDNLFRKSAGQAVFTNFKTAPNLPLLFNDMDNKFLSYLKTIGGPGGVLEITAEQWEEILIRAGGWSDVDTASNQTRTSWTLTENRYIVAEYLSMLEKELANKPYSKAESRRKIVPCLNNRSSSAIELKHQNISAVLRDIGQTFIQGYKPLSNYQKTLAEEVIRQLNEKSFYLDNTTNVERKFKTAEIVLPESEQEKIEVIFTEPPKRNHHRSDKPTATRTVVRNIDFALKEARNKKLGNSGEKFVINVERKRLIERGRKDLADKIKWVSKDKGDGLGYDILSFDEDGAPVFIEVKTTTGQETTAFYLSRTELQRSRELGRDYRLYRVYNFPRQPRIFILPGPLDEFCVLEPVSYRAKL